MPVPAPSAVEHTCDAFWSRRVQIGAPTAFALKAVVSTAQAQEIEPRAYSNAPVGVNFLIAGYAYTRGRLAFDPSVPVKNAKLETSSAVLAYARVLDVWGKSAKFDMIVPYTWLSGSADFAGRPVKREIDGFGDAAFRLSINLYGAPALTLQEFAHYEQDLIVGASMRVSAPLGRYDDRRVVDLGTNRWSFKPELGVSKAVGPLTLEVTAAATRASRTRSMRCKVMRSTASVAASGGQQFHQALRQQGRVRTHGEQLRPDRQCLAIPLGWWTLMRAGRWREL